jgi:hypothetical protein
MKFGGSLRKLTRNLVFGMLEGSPVGNGGAFYIVLEAALDILTTTFGLGIYRYIALAKGAFAVGTRKYFYTRFGNTGCQNTIFFYFLRVRRSGGWYNKQET